MSGATPRLLCVGGQISSAAVGRELAAEFKISLTNAKRLLREHGQGGKIKGAA
jgi:hypothetical protein